jgi:hypothetical protein
MHDLEAAQAQLDSMLLGAGLSATVRGCFEWCAENGEGMGIPGHVLTLRVVFSAACCPRYSPKTIQQRSRDDAAAHSVRAPTHVLQVCGFSLPPSTFRLHLGMKSQGGG